MSVYEAQTLFRLARYLRSCRFPADRSELLVAAVQNHAPILLLRQLSALPAGCSLERTCTTSSAR